MSTSYYFDTCIWRDYNEKRFGSGGRPLWSAAVKLIEQLMFERAIIYYSDVTINELLAYYTPNAIEIMLGVLRSIGMLKYVAADPEEHQFAHHLAKERSLPKGDVLHALLARRLHAILVSQDNDFRRLADITLYKRPEELI